MNKILIVEDTAIFRERMEMALEQSGYGVLSAENSKQALDILHKELPSLILLDVAMPEMDGSSFLRILKEQAECQHVPVVLLSAVAEREYVLKARSLGIKDSLLHSYFSMSELLLCVEKGMNAARQSSST